MHERKNTASKQIILAVVLLNLFISLSCADQADPPVTLYYWGNEGDILASDLVQDFETLHDGKDGRRPIKVIMAQSASVNKTEDPQRLLCGIAGGDPPDVVFFDRFAVGEWASKGAFMSLQRFLEKDQKERPTDPFTLYEEQFYPPCWAEACYNGELFAIPTDTDNRAMYYNIDLFEKHADELIAAGCVDPEDPTKVGPPRTWEQWEKATRILTERDSQGRLIRVGIIPNYGNSWLYIFGWLNGGTFMSDDGKTCTLNEPAIVEALAFMTKLYDIMGGAAEVNAFQTSQEGADLDPFLANKIAMRIDGDMYINNIINLRRDMRFGVTLAPAPEGKKPLGWCGGWSLVIPAGAEHPEEAWEFIKYMVSKRATKIKSDAQRQSARASGNVWIPNISARKDITEWLMEEYLYSDPTISPRFKEAKRVFVDSMPFSKYRPVTPVGQLLWKKQVDALEQGIYKQYDKNDIQRNAQIALDNATATVQRELDKIYKPQNYPVLDWRPVLLTYILLVILSTATGYIYFNRQMRARGYFRREFRAGYLFAAPWFLGFLIFGGGPILFSFFMSFCEYDIFHPPRWVGLKNYVEMFLHDDLFYKSMGNTLFMAIGIPLGMAVSLGIAMLLSFEIRGMAIYRTFFYLPTIMPAVAASILWLWIFNPQEGILNALLQKFGISGPRWLQDPVWAKPALILMGLWGSGGGMIIWLAGLKGIPKHLYEAAEIDGAGRWRRFFSITIPMLSPYILLNLIMGVIGTFQIFTQAYVMTQGGPVNSTLFYAYALFNNAFKFLKMGYASAMAWVLFVIVLALTALQLYISKHWVYYESEK